MCPFTPTFFLSNPPPPTLESLIKVVPFKDGIFRLLRYGDLLRLRRVCKAIKSLSNRFLRTNKRFQDKVREINEDNLALFLQANLPTTSIHISNNSSSSFFDKPEIRSVLHLHGDMITNVRIRDLTCPLSKPAFHFFSNLPNLLHLEIERLHVSKSLKQEPQFTPNFKHLKTLKLNSLFCTEKSHFGYVWAMLDFCESLDYFMHPNIVGAGTLNESPNGHFGRVMDYISRRAINFSLPNLKYYDTEHVWPSYHASSQQFCNLVRLCFEQKVKLLQVRAGFLKNAPVLFATSQEIFTTPIVSMLDVGKASISAELPNLEKLVIESTSNSNFSSNSWKTGAREVDSPKWPNLKELDLQIDSRAMYGNGGQGPGRTSLFVEFLFDRENRREELRDLAIRFEDYCVEKLPVPNPLNVVVSCPFLTKLTLENWIGSDEQVCGFWEGLPLLEEVTLDNCEKLGDTAFVGQVGNENPVTRAGIEHLSNEEFNKSVDKFPFDDWNLGGVSEEEFKQLKLRFRATHMI